MEVTVTTQFELESTKMVYVRQNHDYETIEVQHNAASPMELTKEEARFLARLLNTYADGFEWPPAPVLPQVDSHEAFPEADEKPKP